MSHCQTAIAIAQVGKDGRWEPNTQFAVEFEVFRGPTRFDYTKFPIAIEVAAPWRLTCDMHSTEACSLA